MYDWSMIIIMEKNTRQVDKNVMDGNVRQVDDTFDIRDKGKINRCDISQEERVGQVHLNTPKAGR